MANTATLISSTSGATNQTFEALKAEMEAFGFIFNPDTNSFDVPSGGLIVPTGSGGSVNVLPDTEGNKPSNADIEAFLSSGDGGDFSDLFGASDPGTAFAPSTAFGERQLPETTSPSALSSALTLGSPVSPVNLSNPSLSSGGTALGLGFPLFERTANLLFQAQQQRNQNIATQLSVLNTLIELERVSPTRAAQFRLGAFGDESGAEGLQGISQALLQGLGPSLGGGQSGSIGGFELSTPTALSGRQLSLLGDNPATAGVVADIADFVGDPDLFQRSLAATIPASGTLLGQAF